MAFPPTGWEAMPNVMDELVMERSPVASSTLTVGCGLSNAPSAAPTGSWVNTTLAAGGGAR